MKIMHETVGNFLSTPADERAKLKKADDAIQRRLKRWWLDWWGFLLLGVGIAARWINPFFAAVIGVTFLWRRGALRFLQGAGEAVLNELESTQYENEELKAERERLERDKHGERTMQARIDEEAESLAEAQGGRSRIGFGHMTEREK